MVISAPTDHLRLDLLKQEATNLQAELQRQPSRFAEDGHHFPEIELTLLDQPGREELTQALEQGRFHILHYSGHSNLGPSGGEIYLVSKRTGLTETLSGDDLAGLLVNNNIQMGVFNSCLGAYTAKSNPGKETGERNLTESLVKRGVRSVLAMSERIPDEVALTLTQLFYRNLSQGYPLDLCVSRVRQGLISAYGSHQMYWALPILYVQREFNGSLTPEIGSSIHEEFIGEYPLSLDGISDSLPATMIDSDYPQMLKTPVDIPTDSSRYDPAWLESLGEDIWGDLDEEFEYADSPDQENTDFEEDAMIVGEIFQKLKNPENYSLNRLDADVETEVGSWAERPTEINFPSQDVLSNWVKLQSLPTQKPRRQRQWGILVILLASTIFGIVGMNFWKNGQPVAGISPIPQISTQNFTTSHQRGNTEPKKTQIELIAATAVEKLQQGDLETGLKAVEELINRDALSLAAQALALVPEQQIENPHVNFFRGRLAWKLCQIEDTKCHIHDARKFWEIAVRGQSDSVLYNNALGFAYYAEGDLNHANDSWFKALSLVHKLENPVSMTKESKPWFDTSTALNGSSAHQPSLDLTAYAGLALGLHKSADSQPHTRRGQYINEAIRLRQIVLRDQSESFTAYTLAHNWLWTKQAIADWELLLQQKSN
jgi:tetratricopeptide (TPR) repeat protein